jgi:nitroreductase / dihydropteridine reductase
MNIIASLNWRYATKSMTNAVVPQEKIDSILNATLLCPTSSGLQPFEVILISNKVLKEKIAPIAHNQPIITQSSHLMVFAAWDSYTIERVNGHFAYLNKLRNMPDSTTDNYRKMLLDLFSKQTKEQHFEHAARQSYIGLGFALFTAALEKIDSTPMEGFDSKKLDELLELEKKGLKSTCILALGFRDTEKDWLVNLEKIRKPMSDFITVIA